MTESRRWLHVWIGEGVLAGCVAVVVVTLADLMSYSGWSSIPAEGEAAVWPMIGGVAAILVLLRRHLPSVALIAAALLFGRYVEAGVAVAVIAYGAPRRNLLVPLACVASIAFAMAFHAREFDWRYIAVAAGLASVVCVVMPALVGAWLEQRERLVVTLREHARHLQRANRLAVSEGRLRERARVTEEMHDRLGHRLTLLSLHAGAMEMELAGDTPDLSARARLVHETSRSAMDELRSILSLVWTGEREPVLEPTCVTGTRADVQRLVQESVAAGIAVDLVWSGEDVTDVGTAVRVAMHRVVREALTNAHKHAVGAPVEVRVTHGPDRLRVEVSNGLASTAAPVERLPGSGMGLSGLQATVRQLGGIFHAERTQAGKFELWVDLPLRGGLGMSNPPSVVPGADTSTDDPPRARLRSRLGMMIVLGTGLLAVSSLLLAVFAYLYLPPPHPEISFEVQVNMSEQEVIDRTGGPDPLAALAVGHSHPDDLADAPAGAQCWYRLSGEDAVNSRDVAIDRYCFVNGQLARMKNLKLSVPDSLGRK